MTPLPTTIDYFLVKITLIAGLLLVIQPLHAQRKVAITIDDVPNTRMYQQDHFRAPLLDSLDKMSIPIAIFINEGALGKTDAPTRNSDVLREWIARDYSTLGNHTLHHARYSAVGLDSFKVEIDSGEILTRAIGKDYRKSLGYFRLPYNDLGKDSAAHKALYDYLHSRNYVLTPFTIESSDYMFNYIYSDFLREGKREEAIHIGERYVNYTLQLFEYLDSLSDCTYKRHVHQIYLCHDNPLNRDYLTTLLGKLRQKGYQFISLNEAMTDAIYSQNDYYTKKWGISWLYRWLADPKERERQMQGEPPLKDINDRYEALMKQNAK